MSDYAASAGELRWSARDEGVKRLKRRHAAEMRFRLYGILALLFGLGFLIFLFSSIISKGWTAFVQTSIELPVTFDAQVINPSGNTADKDELYRADYAQLARDALFKVLNVGDDRKERR